MTLLITGMLLAGSVTARPASAECKMARLESIDPAVIAEFSSGPNDKLVIPVSVQFMLIE